MIHTQYADDFPHFSDNKKVYASFRRDQIKKRFDLKTGEVGIVLGNRILVESGKFTATVSIEVSNYTQQILDKKYLRWQTVMLSQLV